MLGLNLESLDSLWPIAIIMATLKILFEIGKVCKSYQENRYYSLDKLKEAFETEKVDNKLREQLVTTYEREVFHKIYKLNIGKYYRRKIIDISNNSCDIELSTFRKANNYITYENENICLIYRYSYPILKTLNKIYSYFYYMLSVFFIVGFLSHFLEYEYLSKIYVSVDNQYVLLFLGLYFLLGSFFSIKKEVSLEAVIVLKKHADIHRSDINIIHTELIYDKIVKKILNIP